MLIKNLAGAWQLKDCNTGQTLPGHLPGCNYLDLKAADLIDDPFWGDNEKRAKELAYHDYEYRRHFTLEKGFSFCDDVALVVSGLDTLAIIHLNGHLVAETENAHRTYRFPIKKLLRTQPDEGNELVILFKSPFPYLEKKQKECPVILSSAFGVSGTQHIRKPLYHFGWDWAPVLPPCGILGEIKIEGHTTARISNVRVEQSHTTEKVKLSVGIQTESFVSDVRMLSVETRLTIVDGISQRDTAKLNADGTINITIDVENPQLWWCNGLGAQPLYELSITLKETDKKGTVSLDNWTRQIGLRTIELNTEADQWGSNFQFKINGVPVFAKGANWIPTDSFVTRTTSQQLDYLIYSAKNANMNMLRVWGGGFYESDAFYSLCDRYGIMVWQDITFACASYSLNSDAYLSLVEEEVRDNVQRLRHHASLTVWCGNNEIKALSDISFKRPKELKQAEEVFFFQTLPDWITRQDSQTPYWPGSPTNGITGGGKANSCRHGDTHLWQVWHGMQPLNAFHKFRTRFCSEYGTESLPSVKTLLRFTNNPEIDLFDPIMLQHQKSGDGNEKMLFYILSRYRRPSTTLDYIYLSQLIQSETIRLATEEWRRNMGRCNGSLYWQYNDCWPTASWAGIEYEGEYKALQYKARHFNSMLCTNAKLAKSNARLYVTNDYPREKKICLRWELRSFENVTLARGEEQTVINPYTALEVVNLKYRALLKNTSPAEVVLTLDLFDEDAAVNRQSILLVPDRDAMLQKPSYKTKLTIKNGTAMLTVTTNQFARHVYLVADAASGPFSDNYFDMNKDSPVTVSFPVSAEATVQSVLDGLKVRSLADVKTNGTIKEDKQLYRKIFFKKKNLLSYILFRILF